MEQELFILRMMLTLPSYKKIKAVIRYDEGRGLPGSSQAGGGI